MKIFLWMVAVLLVVANMAGGLITSRGFEDPGAMVVHLLSYAILAPALLACIYLIPRANRTAVHFLKAFCTLSFLLAASTLYDFVTATAAPKPPQIISGTGSNVEVTVPASWRTSERKTEKQSIYVVDQFATTIILVTSLPKSETAQTFDEFVAAMLEQQHGDKLLAQTGPGPCPIPTLKCAAYEVRRQVGETVTVQILNFVDGGADFHTVVAATSAAGFDRDKANLAKILASFKERT
jgi:hypothetical protein